MPSMGAPPVPCNAGSLKSDMLAPPPLPRALLAPRYWATWLGIGLLCALCALPLPVVRRLGMSLGTLFRWFSASRRHIVRTNLALCFPERSLCEREALMREHFRAVGAGAIEALMAWLASDRRLARYGSVEGIEHLRAACAQGQGALLLTGHFTALELGGRFLVMAGETFHPMYRPAKNALVDYWIRRWRELRTQRETVPRDDLKRLVRLVRSGGRIWYGPDQSLEMTGATFVPFFGTPALTLTATSRLAELGRARVVPFFPERVNGRYRVRVLPALENFPSADPVADAARVNDLIEDAARRVPDQYFWVHRRFKYYRPVPGGADVYGEN